MHSLLHGLATICTLHRVQAPTPQALAANEGLKLDPLRLQQFVVSARARGYTFVSLDELHEVLVRRQPARRLLLLTLDDGYADNCSIAWPLLQQLRVPFAVYICTDFPDRKAILWWYLLEQRLLRGQPVQAASGAWLACDSPAAREQAFMQLRQELLALSGAARDARLQQLFGEDRAAWLQPVAELGLSWQQIHQMSTDPLVTLGAHGISHRALSSLSAEELQQEVAGSCQRLAQMIGRPVQHFCYPFGGAQEAGEREFRLLAELGLRTATTTREGVIRRQHAQRLLALPRYMLSNQFSWPAYARWRWRRLLRQGARPA